MTKKINLDIALIKNNAKLGALIAKSYYSL